MPVVTLRAVDGGPDFYAGNGFTYAASAGWDDPSFFPIGIWDAVVSSQSDIDRWIDLGLNVGWVFNTLANIDLLYPANPVFQVVNMEGGSPYPDLALGAETVGMLAYDEPPYQSDWTNSIATASNSIQDGRYWWTGFVWDQFAYGENQVPSPPPGALPFNTVLATTAETPDGSYRGIDVASVDIYWFAGAFGDQQPYVGNILYDLGTDLTYDQCQRGCRYGDMVDRLRSFCAPLPGGNGAGSKPLHQIIENGGPYTTDTTLVSTTVASGSDGGNPASVASWSSPSAGVIDVASTTGFATASTIFAETSTGNYAQIAYTGTTGTSFTGCTYTSGDGTGTVATGGTVYQSSYITPPQMNQAIWSSIIHGARQISYFNNTFGGPHQTSDDFAGVAFSAAQAGQATSIYAQAKATNALITQLAPVINSPFADWYFTVDPPPVIISAATQDSGIDAMAKYYTGGGDLGNGFYIFATTRESQTAAAITATFAVQYGYSGSVTVMGEDRTVTAAGGVFSDTFALGTDVHIYYIPGVLVSGISLVGQAGMNWPGSSESSQEITYSSTGGNTLVLAFGFDRDSASSGDLTITDSAGNTWQYSAVTASDPPWCQVQVGGGSYYTSFIAWCIGASAVTSVTMSQDSGAHWQGVLSEWAGIVSAERAAESSNGTTTSNVTSPSLNLAHAGDLVVAKADNNGGWGSNTATSFTDDVPGSCYALPGATGPYDITWTNSGTGAAVAVAAFSPPSSGVKYLTGSPVPAFMTTM